MFTDEWGVIPYKIYGAIDGRGMKWIEFVRPVPIIAFGEKKWMGRYYLP